jgi:hypothetical protein
MGRRIEDLDVRILFEVGSRDDARPLLLEVQSLRAAAVQLEGDLFEVENDIRHVFDDALERRELMKNAFDANRSDRRTLDGGEQDPPQRVPDGGSESTLERLGDETPVIRGKGLGIVIELLGFLEI